MKKAFIFRSKLNWVLNATLFTLLAANGLSLVWAAISQRPLFADGFYFFFRMIDEKRFYWDDHYLRIFPAILQIPSVLFLKLSSSGSTVIPSYLFHFTLSLHPLLSLWVSHKILTAFRKTEFFVFPAISFALCTQPLMGYPTIIIPETLSLFWPTFLLFLFREGKKSWETPLLSVLLFCLAFTYETAILLFALIALVVIVRFKQLPSKRTEWLLLLLALAGFTFMLWRILSPNTPKSSFWEGFYTASYHEPFRIVGFIGIGTLTCSLLLGSVFRKLDLLIAAALLAGSVGIWYCFGNALLDSTAYLNFLMEIWYQRTTTVPLVSSIAFTLFVCTRPFCEKWFREDHSREALVFLTCASLLVSVVHDYHVTAIWRSGYDFVKQLRQENPGCNVIDPSSDHSAFEEKFSLGGWWTPMLTMGPEASLEPESIFFVEDPVTGDVCKHDRPIHPRTRSLNAILPDSQTYRYSLQKIKSGIIRRHHWDPESKRLVSTIIQTAAP